MISRRGIVQGFVLGVAGIGGARIADARTASSPVWLSDLATLPVARGPVHVPGQGWFEPVAEEGVADGILRIAGPSGTQWRRMSDGGTLHPHWFIRPGDDNDDDAALIQRACDHAVRFGPFAISLGSRRWDCRSRIVLDPTAAILRGEGAVLDFAALPAPPDDAPLATLADVPETPGWTHNMGVLRNTPGEAETLRLPVSLNYPGRFRISIQIGALSGWADYPALFASIEGADGSQHGDITPIAPGHYTFEVEGPITGAVLTLQPDAEVQIDALEVTAQNTREAILVAATETSPQYGHKWMEGFEIVGPGDDTGLHGIRFQSDDDAKSSRLMMRDITVRDFDTGLVFSHRAYLIRGVGLRIACRTGLHFLGGSRDAGEMLSLTDSVIDGGTVAIRCNDAEFVLSATSIDFVDQIFVGSGQAVLQGCHLEINRPKAADKPLFDLAQGHVDLRGGTFLVTGEDFEAGNQCDHIFELRSRVATAAMDDLTTYNLRTRSGALAGGPGRLDVSHMRGRRPRHMAPLIQRRPERNLLGPMPFSLRASNTPTGPWSTIPVSADSQAIRINRNLRHIWLLGLAEPGAEVGLSLDIRSKETGTVFAALQAIQGSSRIDIGDQWPIDVSTSWTRYMNNTGDTHPSATLDGRMPHGCATVALYLDLSQMLKPIWIDEVFLCAV